MSQKKAKQAASFSGYEFLNVSLSSDDKERLVQLAANGEFGHENVYDLVSQGYKISFSRDTKNNTFIASITDNGEKSPTYRKILTGRGSTSVDAWASVCYKHFYKLGEDWSTAVAPTELDSRFG